MKIVIGIPCYQGVGALTLRSLLSLQADLIENGHECSFDIEAGGSIITKVRNRIVRRFYESGNDYLIFIDADMVFDADDILKLIDSDADVCCISYRYRRPEVKWSSRPDMKDGIQGVKVNDHTWIKTDCAGTGIMALHKRAIARMHDVYSGLVYDDDGHQTVALFDFSIIDGRYWGEDYLFCKRWRDAGGDIWTLADATVGHVGETAYTGNYQTFLEKGQNNGTS